MKVCAYVRVSTEEQSREGVSLDMQRSKVRQYAALHDMELTTTEADEGISAKSIKGRPGIQTVLELVRKKEISGLIVYKLDRLARNAREALEIADLLQKHGCELHSITERIDTSSAAGRLFYAILSAMAQWERETIAERTCAALARKRERGEKTGGDCPYGYEETDGKLIPRADEQRVVQRISALKDRGYSSREIAETLNAEGTKPRRGKRWSHTQILRIIRKAA